MMNRYVSAQYKLSLFIAPKICKNGHIPKQLLLAEFETKRVEFSRHLDLEREKRIKENAKTWSSSQS